jgi:hypothetical protein
MTLAVLDLLREQSVIEVPWPDTRWTVKPDAEETPLEGLQWRLTWNVYLPGALVTALEDYLSTVEIDDLGLAIRLRLWVEIGGAEVERFFDQQLVKHGLPSDWAKDMAFAYRESSDRLSLAQWRYCAWAAVRRGASLVMQQGGLCSERIRELVYHELRRRASTVATGAWPKCALPPYDPISESALARGYLQLLSPLGMAYWNSRPSIPALQATFAR